jgi:hypothetical protein
MSYSYRMNIKVVIPVDKQEVMLKAIQSKKCDSLKKYFDGIFTTAMMNSVEETQKNLKEKISGKFFGNLIASDIQTDKDKYYYEEYVYNYGVQGVYEGHMTFLENPRVQEVLNFVSQFSRTMMYRPYDKENKAPQGSYYIRVGETGFECSLRKKGSSNGKTYAKAVSPTNSKPQSPSACAAKPKASSPFMEASNILSQKMEEMEMTEKAHAETQALISELQDKLIELETKRKTLKKEVVPLKKQVYALMKEEMEKLKKMEEVSGSEEEHIE